MRQCGERDVEERVYSIDRNLWGLAIEGEDLEDPWVEPPEDAYLITKDINNTPNDPIYLEIGFKEGMPNKLNGKAELYHENGKKRAEGE